MVAFLFLFACMRAHDCSEEVVYVKLPYSDVPQTIRASDYCGNLGVSSTYINESVLTVRCKCVTP